MFRKQFGLCLIAILGLLHMNTASAALVGFSPSNQNVTLGNPVSVDLVISDLGNDILTGFDLDISFDASILGFQSFTFGTGLDTFGFGTNITDVMDSGAGVVSVFELSFDLDEDLELFQPDDFVLGTFNFSTLSVGTSALNIAAPPPPGVGLAGGLVFDPALGFEVASELDMQVQAGSITVVPPAVIPVPAAVWLFGTGLIGLIGFSKRRKAVQ